MRIMPASAYYVPFPRLSFQKFEHLCFMKKLDCNCILLGYQKQYEKMNHIEHRGYTLCVVNTHYVHYVIFAVKHLLYSSTYIAQHRFGSTPSSFIPLLCVFSVVLIFVFLTGVYLLP